MDQTRGIQHLASWLKGTGAVAIFNLMKDGFTLPAYERMP
jgi:hypothetical protein